MKLLKTALLAITMFTIPAMAGQQWNGIGKILELNIYPNYAVVAQGNSGGVAGCTDTYAYSFSWSDFTPEVQSRIHSVLLHAYTTKANIEVLVSSTECGPEGLKKFLGFIRYK